MSAHSDWRYAPRSVYFKDGRLFFYKIIHMI